MRWEKTRKKPKERSGKKIRMIRKEKRMRGEKKEKRGTR